MHGKAQRHILNVHKVIEIESTSILFINAEQFATCVSSLDWKKVYDYYFYYRLSRVTLDARLRGPCNPIINAI